MDQNHYHPIKVMKIYVLTKKSGQTDCAIELCIFWNANVIIVFYINAFYLLVRCEILRLYEYDKQDLECAIASNIKTYEN